MKLLVDENNLIIGYELLGYSDGFEIDPDKLPDNFFDNYEANKYLLDGANVIENTNYQAPNFLTFLPSDQDKLIASLTGQVASLTQQVQTGNQTNAQLILEIAQLKQQGGTSDV